METAQTTLYDAQGARKYLTAAERQAFLNVARHSEPRRRAFCELLVQTGCRLSEALAVTQEHVNALEAFVIFRTLKRRKPHFRAVPIPQDLAERLIALPLFDDQSRTPQRRLFPWCRQTGWEQVKLLMTAAGVAGPQACPKGLRHGFGMRTAALGVPPGLTQRWLGHARLETTAIYQHAVGAEERAFAHRIW